MGHGAVLVCDDDDSIREIVSQVVEANGFDVVAVDSGAAALHALTMTEFRCAFLDIDLPDIPGFEVARQARAILPHCPRLVALTGRISRRDFLASREAGFDLHLVKPIDVAQIVVALATLRVMPST
jgi:CheY-like chemotaxis protein